MNVFKMPKGCELMFKKTIKFFAILSLVSGCASSITVKPVDTHAFTQKAVKNYEVGVVQEAYVGDAMIRVTKSHVYNNVAGGLSL
ncbi:hypothetical protein [Roseospira visakhapatnamensis]|uniref:Uncharacterized protein n=1 Tax=Roseospira visakhapatnamensis TaxID=390880 RepID=A0A7W6RD31_9PROT|nr:hypothetical protein [Roseospira visakhapatnamensis]MBB4266349.1 hypothetical protein [Roseospira visakhapatnamensis]